ncbi:MAG TPA: exonuclease SbcCD subunit D, partial [Methanothrix sp.]|nr:exonuclease SbcCD subunit D [Methanothrix sp.]
NAWYSGSVEYFNFGEAGDEKGMLLVDTETGRTDRVAVRPKYMIDHPAIDCGGMHSEQIAESLMNICSEEGEIEDKMVRITLKNVSRAAYKRLDQPALARLGAGALYFKIRPEFSDEKEHIERPVDRRSLPEEFCGFLEEKAGGERIPAAIKMEVVTYGSLVMKKAAEARQKEALDAS